YRGSRDDTAASAILAGPSPTGSNGGRLTPVLTDRSRPAARGDYSQVVRRLPDDHSPDGRAATR
ncbi:MAG: hypothetical protein ACXVXU_18610, partial [Blastococcus sp.]